MSERLRWEIDPKNLDQSMRELGDQVRRLAEAHRYSKVRISWKGKPVLPDIPLAAFVASEVASFWLVGPLRVLLVNLGVGSVLDVDLVNEADERTAAGKQLFADGEVEGAEAAYREALRMRPGDPSASYHLAVLLRVTGRKADAAQALESALSGGSDFAEKEKAEALLEKLRG